MTVKKNKKEKEGQIQAGSLTDQAYKVLEEMISTLQLAPGSVISESALAQNLGIGRTPVREALQGLAREGLVVILPRKGILVSEINPGSQLLVLEVRRELERLMVRAASQRATDKERKQFLEIAAGMKKAAKENDDINFMRLDRIFNQLLASAAHNEYASRSMRLMNGLSRRFWYVHYRESADLPLCARLHAAVAERIAKGDTEGAADASDRLVDYAETFTRATLETRNIR